MAKSGLSAAAAGLLMAACADGAVEASAQQAQNETPAKAEIVLAAAEVDALTRADCLALDTRAKLICLREVQAAEIDALNADLEEDLSENAAKKSQREGNAEIIRDNEEANDERRTRNDVLIAELKGKASQ